MVTSIFKRFAKDRSGSIAQMFALSVLPTIMFVGVTIDYSNVSRHQTQTSDASDAAILAAAIALRESGLVRPNEADTQANMGQINQLLRTQYENYLSVNMNYDSSFSSTDYEITYDPATGEIAAHVNATYNPYIMDIFGYEKMDVAGQSVVNLSIEAGGAISMFMVLDKSGSMRGDKIDDLKTAVANMSTEFQQSDPEAKYVRIGAIAYDSRARTPQNISWGPVNANNYVQTLRAGGGTNSTNAMRTAHRHLVHTREASAHLETNGHEEFSKVAVFMTDGANNRTRDDNRTRTECDRMKTAGIEIYSVAFRAPQRGQALLRYCASSADHYFDAQNSDQLSLAFSKIGANVTSQLALAK